jgi:FkbM family methyltransferase
VSVRIPGFGRLKNATRGVIARNRRSRVIQTLHGLAAFIESSYNNNGSDIASNGERRVITQLAKADFRCVMDVGANNGDWAWEALTEWPSSRAHLFEVAPKTYETLAGRLNTSALADRVVLNQLGVSDHAGEQEMHYFPDHPDLTCDLPRHAGYTTVRFHARMETLDRYCEANQIRQVDFLKIDVEGAEYKVLRGFRERLEAQGVHCIQFEYGAFSTQTRVLLQDYYDLLAKTYWIGKIYPTYVDFRDYAWTMEDYQFCNYCCVSTQRPDLRRLLAE